MSDLSKRLRARAAKLRRFGYSYGELSVNDLDEIANALDAPTHGADARTVPYRAASDCQYVGVSEEIKCAWADGWNQCAQFTKGSHDGH